MDFPYTSRNLLLIVMQFVSVCEAVCLCVGVSVCLTHWHTNTQTYRHTDTHTHRLTERHKLHYNQYQISTWIWKIQNLKKKYFMEKPYLLWILFKKWLFQREFWKDNCKGFSNLVLKVAHIIWQLEQTIHKCTSKYILFIYSQV